MDKLSKPQDFIAAIRTMASLRIERIIIDTDGLRGCGDIENGGMLVIRNDYNIGTDCGIGRVSVLNSRLNVFKDLSKVDIFIETKETDIGTFIRSMVVKDGNLKTEFSCMNPNNIPAPPKRFKSLSHDAKIPIQDKDYEIVKRAYTAYKPDEVLLSVPNLDAPDLLVSMIDVDGDEFSYKIESEVEDLTFEFSVEYDANSFMSFLKSVDTGSLRISEIGSLQGTLNGFNVYILPNKAASN